MISRRNVLNTSKILSIYGTNLINYDPELSPSHIQEKHVNRNYVSCVCSQIGFRLGFRWSVWSTLQAHELEHSFPAFLLTVLSQREFSGPWDRRYIIPSMILANPVKAARRGRYLFFFVTALRLCLSREEQTAGQTRVVMNWKHSTLIHYCHHHIYIWSFTVHIHGPGHPKEYTSVKK
jgi:hypothetical protein